MRMKSFIKCSKGIGNSGAVKHELLFHVLAHISRINGAVGHSCRAYGETASPLSPFFSYSGSTFSSSGSIDTPITRTHSTMEHITENEFLEWIRTSVRDGKNILSRGYQGHVYLYRDKGRPLVIKAPMGWGLGRLIRLLMLRNEYRVYSRLSEMKGIPRCHGLLDKRYLVLEYIDGPPIRNARITERSAFFEALLTVIKGLHEAGVAHTDLKKKDNVLVVDGKTPYVIDFGVAVVWKPGFAPINHYLYNIASRFDFNAWVKLKYSGKYEEVTEKDSIYYHRTLIEKVSRWIKDTYLIVKKTIIG
jgi:predicted Ser/Thr protein kinase